MYEQDGFVSLVEVTVPGSRVDTSVTYNASCVCYDCVSCDTIPEDDEGGNG
jgi:hypothetical protein